MKLTKVSGGWLVEPHTKDEAKHLAYVLEGLANQPRAKASDATEGSLLLQALRLPLQGSFPLLTQTPPGSPPLYQC